MRRRQRERSHFRRRQGTEAYSRIVRRSVSCLFCLALSHPVVGNDFDPYQLNGGLVSAVAGRNYVVLAADSRMIGPGGYDILERNHVSSRLWEATDATMAAEDTQDGDLPFKGDGSLAIPASDAITSQSEAALTMASKRVSRLSGSTPVLIGSAGCNADCEMLKRTVRAELRKAHYFGESQLRAAQVAILLSQILYSRRSFPYYSFCIVAGLDKDPVNGDSDGGHVYVYDAIGSFEQVAVATTGTGRELLQPILDRKFRARTVDSDDDTGNRIGSISERMQLFGKIPATQVDCSREVAVSILLDGYRAVSEREIGVGDQVAFCVLTSNEKDARWECQVWTAPLKKH